VPTDSMATARFDHAALIVAGQVLAAGGRTALDGSVTATAELYDAKAGTWSPTSALTVPRAGAGAITLKDGRGLIVGGDSFAGGKANYLASAEVFDHKNKVFVGVGDMTTPRFHPAALRHPTGVAVFIGGAPSPGSAVATMEIFEPSKGTFAEAGNMTEPREGEALVYLKDGRLLITGGRIDDGQITELAEVCNLTTRTCRPVPSLIEPRADHTATLMPDGAVLLVGGTTVINGETVSASSSSRLYLPSRMEASPSPQS